jgi:DNA-binding NtrC family response regulator
MHSLLIVDDDAHILKSLARLLRSKDRSIDFFSDPTEALSQCSAREYDLVLCDQRMPLFEGTEFFYRLAQIYPNTRRILISGYADFTSVTEAFNDGIIHKFIVKPWDNEILKQLVISELSISDNGEGDTAKSSVLRSVKPLLKGSSDTIHYGILTQDPSLQQQLSIIDKAGSSDAPFFIHGETGTGKEMIAKAIHQGSNRREKLFLAFNCANLTETLLESQLFGHVKGAFTGADSDQIGLLEEAEGGTLFMDEVTEIPLPLQAKLLRVFQEREYTPVGKTRPISFDVKIISASSTSLEKAVEQGRFREDLRYRLEVMPINLPPLRARGTDKRLLFDHFLTSQLLRHNAPQLKVSQEVYNCIDQYNWPGNVRELVNVCTYIAALAGKDDQEVSLEKLPPVIRAGAVLLDERVDLPLSYKSLYSTGKSLAKKITEDNLRQATIDFQGNRESIAKHFGISRMTLWRKIKKFNLEDI